MNSLKTKLKLFKLAGMLNSLEQRVAYANQNQLSYLQFLELLCEDEENSRKDNSYKKRYIKSKLPTYRTIEEFDFNFQPSIDRKIINDVSTCNFLPQRKNVIFIGNPGTGKSHLAIAIAIKALAIGRKVLFSTTSEMLRQIHISKADNTYYRKLNDYTEPELLILDELGFKKLPSYSADDFFEVVAKRYEKGSIIITTNKSFENWNEIFEDHILADAIKDRIMHHAIVFKINGPSYRTKKIKEQKEKSS